MKKLRYMLPCKKLVLGMGISAAIQLLFVSAGFSQIDFSVLDKWRGNQRPAFTRTINVARERNEQVNNTPVVHQPTEKEIRQARAYAEKQAAEVRKNLITPNANTSSVTYSLTTVNTVQNGGYLNSTPNGGGAFYAFAADTRNTRATAIPTVAIRRTVAILAKASEGSAEDMFSLAEQASIAMQGGDLQVKVNDNAINSSEKQEQQFRDLVQELSQDYQDIEFVKKEEDLIDKEANNVDADVYAGKISKEEGKAKLLDLTKQLINAKTKSEKAKEDIKKLPKKIETIYVLVH
ncbi:hypothetical protein [Mucilaginibacter sp. OK098]|uniref:hypothetical protein n=1 Tax=Mucilaginibacter sp. OK098 TaxID=1855297 RepID=UPI000922734D|nr:hypothetical protein [Mucilaginibacter sp. OK098]SHM81198.1 hypothetical protein SAMN05216524_103501 [Mucilaginibacter sp. OK098]